MKNKRALGIILVILLSIVIVIMKDSLILHVSRGGLAGTIGAITAQTLASLIIPLITTSIIVGIYKLFKWNINVFSMFLSAWLLFIAFTVIGALMWGHPTKGEASQVNIPSSNTSQPQ